jgi:2,4-dienoyl-CoA reductase-like NADH-dependent reductase (Old Yellow Enzyme family)
VTNDAVLPPAASPVPDPFTPARLGPIELRNRFIKAATFEARSPKRLVTDELVEFHREMVRGGVGLTTVAYCAVQRAGSTDARTICLDEPEVETGLARLTDAVHELGGRVSAQIGHAGPVADPNRTRRPVMTPSRIFTPLGMRMTHALSTAEVGETVKLFGHGAAKLAAAGFDAIEVHLGHNYLASAFMSPKLNKRTDGYGGDVVGRARFPREIVAAVRDAVGDRCAVIAKFNMDDGVPGGLWLDEALQIAQLLESDGHLDALELTAGSSLGNPMYYFRGDAPVREMAENLGGVVGTGFRLVGHRFLKTYPYEDGYLLPSARQFRAALRMPLILLGGVSQPDTVDRALAEGFEFVAMGRALLREPDIINRWASGRQDSSLCVHCNKCMPSIYTRTRCVLIDPTP